MKRLAVITTSLILTLGAFGGTAAFAEETETAYPQDSDFIKTLSFESLTDYELSDGVYYFKDGETLYSYEDGKLGVSGVDGSDFEFTPAQSNVNIENYTFNLTGTTLQVAVFGEDSAINTFAGEYSCLKQFGEYAYAVKDNSLYRFDGPMEPTEIILNYVDYSVTGQIAVGNTAEELKNYEALTFVTVKAGAFMTAIDLTSLDGEYFVLENAGDKADVSENTVKVKEDTTALLLCYSGNAALISIGDTSYITLKTATSETDVNCKTEAEFTNATIVGNRIYSSPFTVIGTTSLPDASGTIVAVKYKLEYPTVLNSVYYEVEYIAEDETVKIGYVAYGHLTEYIIEDNKEPETVPDPEYSESNRITTVLLVLAVVILVLIAVGYITYTATSGKKKKNKKEPEEKEEEQN